MKFKHILIILILLCGLFCLSGCYDSNNVETLAYPVAVGIDKVDDSNIMLTVQIASSSSQSSESSSSSQSTSSTLLNVQCSTIDDGISLINSYISKTLNLAHCKAIVMSEELAYEGVSDYIYGLANNVQMHPDCYIIISRCDAHSFLSNSSPSLESVSARYYEFISTSSKYTSYTEKVSFSNFYESILSTTCNPVAILGGINTSETQKSPSNSNASSGTYKANETPLQTDNSVENMGLAVFVGDSLVGELNNLETLSHMIVSNKLKNATITIPNPYDKNSNLSLEIYLAKNTQKDVNLINNYPYIDCDVSIHGYLLNLNDTINLTDPEIANTINEAASLYLKNLISDYLYKTSKNFHSDIDEFGKYVISNYITWNDWESADWLNNYQNAFFNVNVDVNIISGQLFNNF